MSDQARIGRTILGSGHLTPLEEPAGFARLLEDFLDSLPLPT